jgi:hypothetical protein
VNRKFIQTFIAILFLITACSQVPARVTPPATSSPAQSQSKNSTSTPHVDATRTPREPRNEPTNTPITPTTTPTLFDSSLIITFTPGVKEQCPVIDPTMQIDFDFRLGTDSNLDQLNKKTLDFLNSGGDPARVIEKARRVQYALSNTDTKPEERGLQADITGDGVPELLIAPDVYYSIFNCKAGKYRLIDTFISPDPFGVDFKKVEDINKNGIAEIYVYETECMGGRCYILLAKEWNGSELEPIIIDGVGMPDVNPEHYCDDIDEPFDINFHDVDKDGLEELIIAGKIPTWPDDLLFPYRKETRICKWNGRGYVFYKKEFSEPQYRFQAIQDADLAASQGEYKKSISLYQRTISDQNLGWWSSWERMYQFAKSSADFFGSPLPTPDPTIKPEPREYPSLAAYAYYRIIVLNILQGNPMNAEATYNILQKKFRNNPYGKPYVEMATDFWTAYKSTQKMYDGCAAAIEYAVEHPEILEPLGSSYHGFQSHLYVPADVCPFR